MLSGCWLKSGVAGDCLQNCFKTLLIHVEDCLSLIANRKKAMHNKRLHIAAFAVKLNLSRTGSLVFSLPP